MTLTQYWTTLQNYFRKLLNRAEIDNNEHDKMRPVSTIDQHEQTIFLKFINRLIFFPRLD